MGNISAGVRERQDQNQRGKDTGERNDQGYDDTNAEDNIQEKSKNNERNRRTHGKSNHTGYTDYKWTNLPQMLLVQQKYEKRQKLDETHTK